MYNSIAKEIINYLDWQPSDYSYTRATLDSKPYQIVRDKNGSKSTIVFNALGISKNDIKIDVIRERGVDYLTISGESRNDLLGKTYSVNGRFSLDSDTINSIEWETRDGLLNVVVSFKESEKPKIKIVSK